MANCRFLPDADLPTVVIEDEFIQQARETLPPSAYLAAAALIRPPYNVHPPFAHALSQSTESLAYFNAVVEAGDHSPRTIAHWYLAHLLVD